jgi:hypothetical protein
MSRPRDRVIERRLEEAIRRAYPDAMTHYQEDLLCRAVPALAEECQKIVAAAVETAVAAEQVRLRKKLQDLSENLWE